MGIEHRPYVGSWRLDNRELVSHTPDALVYLNGDLTLPGCHKCNGRIDIQKYVIEVSTDHGTDPTSASGSFTLSVPYNDNHSFARDARSILRPGLEVQIYERGFFPVKGLYSNLGEPRNLEDGVLSVSGQLGVEPAQEFKQVDSLYPASSLVSNGTPNAAAMANLTIVGEMMTTLQGYLEEQGWTDATLRVTGNGGYTERQGSHTATTIHFKGKAVDFQGFYTNSAGNRREINHTLLWASIRRLRKEGLLPPGGIGMYLEPNQEISDDPQWSSSVHMDIGNSREWVYEGGEGSARKDEWIDHLDEFADGLMAPEGTLPSVIPVPEKTGATPMEGDESPDRSASPDLQAPLLDELGLQGQGIEDVLAYPYYPVFHGIVTNVSVSRSGPSQTITVQCASMLNFWQYHRISTNASLFGARPDNSKNKVSLVGHNFTGMHPYEIMYTLYTDVGGAAAGVSWALSQKTNQDAKGITDDSLFSLNIKYWEQRFQNRQTKLRLHGADGRLFSAAQADWLGRASSKDLTKFMSNRFEAVSQDTKSIMAQAEFLGMRSQQMARSLQFLRRSRPGGVDESITKPRFEMNLGEMQAFVLDIGNMGQVQLFESTYQSKQDIASQVMEITGFEFYQDVDGDFVFKPPMYNLDTSGSRVYRIEDIDIISISFTEKEPEVTYMTGKGPGFKNVMGTGLEGEWGVQGQYIDYRLVAQYGWRPGDFEVAYFNDPKSLFFASVNRMDLLNIGVNSANVTIPLRPELRPGYPVYIPYLDCFYYCSSFSHSFSVGGDCTTAMELSGKRAKFYAPGDPSREGIGAIDLANTNLPERPLEVLGDDGRPRLAGFPNVVMALDPTQINPLFFIVGEDIDNITNPFTMQSILNMGVKLDILFTDDPSNPGPRYWTIEDENRNKEFYFVGPEGYSASAESSAKPSGAVDLKEAAKDYSKFKSEYEEGSTEQRAQQTALENQIDKEEAKLRDLERASPSLPAKEDETAAERKARKKKEKALQKSKDKAKARIKKKLDGGTRTVKKKAEDGTETKKTYKVKGLRKQLEEINTAYAAAEKAYQEGLKPAGREGISDLVTLVKRIGQRYLSSTQPGGGTSEDANATYNLLDMLGDKKAIMTNGSLPGSYRYYSASHPNPEHQGQMEPEFSVKDRQDQKSLSLGVPSLAAEWQGQEVDGFRDVIGHPVGSANPEAEITKIIPTRGIRVLTNNPEAPRGEVLPTNAIHDLVFATHDVRHRRKGTSTKRKTQRTEWSTTFKAGLRQMFLGVWTKPAEKNTIEQVFGTWYTQDLPWWILQSQLAAQEAVESNQEGLQISIPEFPVISLPEEITIRNAEISVDAEIKEYVFSDNPVEASLSKGSLFKGAAGMTLDQFWVRVVTVIAHDFGKSMDSAMAEWKREMQTQGIALKYQEDAITAFTGVWAGFSGDKQKPKDKKKEGKKGKRGSLKTTLSTPVFPVSDAKGYQVVGSYRYGRGLDVSADGVWDSLAQQDPLTLVDARLVSQFVDALVMGRPIYVDHVETLEDGTKRTVKKKLVGESAVTYAETALKEELKGKLTHSQLLDLSLALQTGDPNMLQINMSNYLSTKGKDGVQKLPIQNAGLSLADLNLQTGQNICSCKSAEADVLLESAGQQDFVQFIKPGVLVPQEFGDGTQDKPTQWLMSRAAEASVDWKLSQDALRGSAPSRQPTGFVQATQDLHRQFQEGIGNDAAIDRAVEAVEGAAGSVEQAGRDVVTAFGGESTTPEQFNAEVAALRAEQEALESDEGDS